MLLDTHIAVWAALDPAALLAQAQEEGLRLLTRDTKMIGHPMVAA